MKLLSIITFVAAVAAASVAEVSAQNNYIYYSTENVLAPDSLKVVPTVDSSVTARVKSKLNADMYWNAGQWKNPVKKGTIYVNEDITTHVVMPEGIKLVDISTSNIVGNQCADNMIRLKPQFPTDSLGHPEKPMLSNSLIGSITVIGERHIAQLEVVYVFSPRRATSIYKIPYEELDNYVNPEVEMSQSDMAKYCWAIYASGRRFNNITSSKHGMKAMVNNIYSVGDYFFIDFSLQNKTKVKYEINEMRVFLTDKKEVKATNSQTIELTPAYSLNLARDFSKNYRNVLVVEKLTFPEEKVLRIEISENQISGRVIELTIEYEDILNADGFSRDLLKKIPDVALPHIYK